MKASPAGDELDLHQQVALAAGQRLVHEAALDGLGQGVGEKTRDAVREMVAEEVPNTFAVREQRTEERVVGSGKTGHFGDPHFCCGDAIFPNQVSIAALLQKVVPDPAVISDRDRRRNRNTGQ